MSRGTPEGLGGGMTARAALLTSIGGCATMAPNYCGTVAADGLERLRESAFLPPIR